LQCHIDLSVVHDYPKHSGVVFRAVLRGMEHTVDAGECIAAGGRYGIASLRQPPSRRTPRYDALVRSFLPPSTQPHAVDAVGAVVAVERIFDAMMKLDRVRTRPVRDGRC
jgi:histidyl-tRNA synthetase